MHVGARPVTDLASAFFLWAASVRLPSFRSISTMGLNPLLLLRLTAQSGKVQSIVLRRVSLPAERTDNRLIHPTAPLATDRVDDQ